MRRRTFLGMASAGTTLGLAGCLSSLGAGSGDTPGAVANPGSDSDNAGVSTIEVAGTGEMEAEPEIARMNIGVEAEDSEADVVRAELAEQSDEVEAALLGAGIDEDDITTSRYQIRDPSRSPGFEGTHQFDVTVRDIDAIGSVIDDAVEAGADDVGRVDFTLTEETRGDLRDDALEQGIENARDEADVIADAKDVEIVGVIRVATTDTGVQPFRSRGMYLQASADDGGATDIREGPVTVTAQVEVVYGIE